MGSTAVRYMIQWMLPRTYPLECTQHAGVSDIVCTLLFCSTLLQCLHVLQKSGSHIAPLYIVNKVDYSLSVSYRGSSIVCLKRCYEIKPSHMVIMKPCAHSKIGLTIISAANRGRQMGSVAGPPNSPGLFQIRSGSSVTFQSSFFKGFILLYFRLNSACFLVLRFMLPFNLKPLIEGGNLQVYIYCVSSQKKASGAPRTHFRACKISTFSGRIPPDPPRTIHIVGPHFLSLPWARPILLAALTIITRL